MDSKKQSYSITYKNSAGRNLMVYTFKDHEELEKYQLEMLANNRIKGLLKSEVFRLNGEIHLQYDITSLVPIRKLFERKKFSRKDFHYFIKQIIEVIGIMERYLLDSSGIVFDSTYIFADPQNLEMGYTYLPTKERAQSIDSLKNFLLDTIINEIRFVDEPSDNFIQRLIEILKDPEFEESSLKKYLSETDKVKSTPVHNKRVEQDIPKQEAEIKLLSQQRAEQKTFDAVKIKKLCYPAKSYIVLFSVIGTLILFCVALVLSGILSPSNPDSLLSLFGFILIGGAVTYLVYSKLFTPDKKTERIIEEKSKGVFTGQEYVNKAFNIPIHRGTDTPSGSTIKKEATPIPMRKPFYVPGHNGLFTAENEIAVTEPFHNNVRNVPIQDRTVILNASNFNLPYLKRTLGNSTETIIIKQFPFMMGRLEGQVDYCINNPAVGKLHAEITKTDESYFISDMNSINGTIINGERIEPTKKSIISNGDRITLGNEEFIFYCGNSD